MVRGVLAVGIVVLTAAQARAQLPRGPLPPLPPLPEPAPDASPASAPAPAPPEPAQADPSSSAGEDDAYVPEDWISPSELPSAQPSETDRAVDPEIVSSAYPRELVRRPLFLPAGGRQASISFGIGRNVSVERSPSSGSVRFRPLTYGLVELGGRYSFGEADLYLGGELLVFEDHEGGPPEELPTVQTLFAGARFLSGEETALGLQMVLGDVGAASAYYSPTLFLARRVPLSAWSTIRLGGGLSYSHQNVRDSYLRDEVVRRASIYGHVTVQAQATPALGFQVTATYTQYTFLNDTERVYPAFRHTGYTASAVIAVADTVDLVPYLSSYATWPGDGKIACLSLAGRWLP